MKKEEVIRFIFPFVKKNRDNGAFFSDIQNLRLVCRSFRDALDVSLSRTALARHFQRSLEPLREVWKYSAWKPHLYAEANMHRLQLVHLLRLHLNEDAEISPLCRGVDILAVEKNGGEGFDSSHSFSMCTRAIVRMTSHDVYMVVGQFTSNSDRIDEAETTFKMTLSSANRRSEFAQLFGREEVVLAEMRDYSEFYVNVDLLEKLMEALNISGIRPEMLIRFLCICVCGEPIFEDLQDVSQALNIADSLLFDADPLRIWNSPELDRFKQFLWTASNSGNNPQECEKIALLLCDWSRATYYQSIAFSRCDEWPERSEYDGMIESLNYIYCKDNSSVELMHSTVTLVDFEFKFALGPPGNRFYFWLIRKEEYSAHRSSFDISFRSIGPVSGTIFHLTPHHRLMRHEIVEQIVDKWNLKGELRDSRDLLRFLLQIGHGFSRYVSPYETQQGEVTLIPDISLESATKKMRV